MPPKMEFFNGAKNFTMGNVEFNTTQGNHYDHSVRNVRNTYGDKNRYYTNNNNRYYNNSTNYNGDYHAPATHYHGPVNNVQRGQIVTGNVNGGNFYKPEMGNYNNQGPVVQSEGDNPPPAGPGYGQYPPPPPGHRPGPAPVPYDEDFTDSDPAVPQYQDFSQQRGPPRPNLNHHPYSGPDDYQGWGQHQQQGPPPAFPPRGPQGYPQHPPQDPNYRPTGAPFRPPHQQRQPPPQQQRWQGPEQWPGQHAYERGMAHLKQNNPASWNTNGNGDSDSSDEDDSDSDAENVQRMEHPNRPDHGWMNPGPSQPSLGQFARQQRQPQAPPPPGAADEEEDEAGLNGSLASMSLGEKKKKRRKEHRDPMN